MSTAGVPLWSTTAASNSTADPAVNWAEGQAPSSVNDSARAMMASVAKWRNDLYGITTGGTSTAYTITTGSTFASAAAMSGAVFTIIPNATSGAAPTLAVDGLTARAINISTGVAIPTGALVSGTPYLVKYVHASTEFILLGMIGVLPASIVATANIADDAVTYAKMQNISATSRLLGRATSGAGDTEEITIGTGLNLSGTTISAPAFPPPSSFKNLVIKVTGNTAATVAADFVTTTDGTNYLTTALSGTLDLSSNGAVNKLDTGSIASATWYAVWAIAKADGTTGGLVSTSFTSPTLPTGYTFKARIGAIRTAAGSAQLLGTWQFGRDVQYVVGLAQCSALPNIDNGVNGTFSVSSPTWDTPSITSVVPTTASQIAIVATNNWNAQSIVNMSVAPSNAYGGQSTTNPPFFSSQSGDNVCARFSMTLETTTIAWCSSGAGGGISCAGWHDNL